MPVKDESALLNCSAFKSAFRIHLPSLKKVDIDEFVELDREFDDGLELAHYLASAQWLDMAELGDRQQHIACRIIVLSGWFVIENYMRIGRQNMS